jgi:hypothetical protein
MINTAGQLTVPGTWVTGRRRLLQTGTVTAYPANTTICPYSLNQTADPVLPQVQLEPSAAPIITPPTAVDDLYYCGFNLACTRTAAAGVLANDTTPNSSQMNVTGVVSGPASGSLNLNTDGSFTFTPAT